MKTARRTPTPEPSPPALETLLTAIDVAAHLGKTVDAARKMIRRGQIPGAVRLGREWRVKRSVFQVYLANLPED
jgi:excisionase family DNA binding protein